MNHQIKCQGTPWLGQSISKYLDVADITSVGIQGRKQVMSYCRVADMIKKRHVCLSYRHLKMPSEIQWTDIGEAFNHFGETLPEIANREWGTNHPAPQIGNGKLGRRSFEISYGDTQGLPLYFLSIKEISEHDYHLRLHWIIKSASDGAEMICGYPIHDSLTCLNLDGFCTYLRYIGYDLAYNQPGPAPTTRL